MLRETHGLFKTFEEKVRGWHLFKEGHLYWFYAKNMKSLTNLSIIAIYSKYSIQVRQSGVKIENMFSK